MTIESHLIESPNKEIASAVILIAHLFHARLSSFQRFESCFLTQDRRAKHAVLMDLHHRLNQFRRSTSITDPEASHCKRFRKAVQEKRRILHSRQARDTRMFSLKSQFRINFVADDQKIFLSRKTRDSLKLFPFDNSAGRICRKI